LRAMLWPGLAFLGTALIGVWAAYDRQAAWVRFGLIALGLVLAAGIAAAGERGGEDRRGFIGIGCGILAAMIGAYYLFGHDWAQDDRVKLAWLHQAGLWVQTHRPSISSLWEFNSNEGGSVLALLLPLGLGGCAWAWAQRRWAWMAIAALAVILTLAALALSQNRGAWLGLGAGVLSGGYLAWQVRQRRSRNVSPARSRRHNNLLLVGVTLLMAGAFWAAVTLPAFGRLVGTAGAGGESAMGRAAIWQSMLPLVGDYFFTGSGLGSTMMVYSSYVIMMHVGYLSHAHNLYLQIAIEQGILGLAAFIWLASSAIRTLLNPDVDRVPGLSLRIAALASITVLVVHSMVDALPYSSVFVPLMFLPVGAAFAFHVSPSRARAITEGGLEQGQAPVRRGKYALLWTGATALLALGALLLPATRAMLLTNLGAVAQTRAELSRYRWPDWPIQDALRRSPDVDLAPAVAQYEAALRLDLYNPSANRRLGQIELSQGDYAAAQRHLATAFVAAPEQQASRQLLGESYAISGDMAKAATLWRTVDRSKEQLVLRQWWYEHVGESLYAERIGEASGLAQLAP
jgi:hypothetical protein